MDELRLLDEGKKAAEEAKMMGKKRAKSPSVSSGDSSSTPDSQAAKSRQRNLTRRRKRRLAKRLDQVLEAVASGLTLLEKKAIRRKTEKYYKKELAIFVANRNLDWEDAETVDGLLAEHMQARFLQGDQSQHGDKLLAAVMHFHPAYGRYGSKKILRAWRALNPDPA